MFRAGPHPNHLISPPTQPKTQNATTHLLQPNHKIQPNLGDSNCFLRFLSYYQFQIQKHHLQMRNEIVEVVSDHVDLFQSLAISDDRNYTLLNHLKVSGNRQCGLLRWRSKQK